MFLRILDDPQSLLFKKIFENSPNSLNETGGRVSNKADGNKANQSEKQVSSPTVNCLNSVQSHSVFYDGQDQAYIDVSFLSITKSSIIKY